MCHGTVTACPDLCNWDIWTSWSNTNLNPHPLSWRHTTWSYHSPKREFFHTEMLLREIARALQGHHAAKYLDLLICDQKPMNSRPSASAHSPPTALHLSSTTLSYYHNFLPRWLRASGWCEWPRVLENVLCFIAFKSAAGPTMRARNDKKAVMWKMKGATCPAERRTRSK